MRFFKRIILLVGVSSVCVASGAFGDAVGRKVLDVLEASANHIGRPSGSVLVAVTTAGKRLVAVGERGRIILSDDNGATWRQSNTVPVRVTLTAVSFATPQKGWAVGHSGVVLRTEDSGETWSKQLDGIKAAQLVVDSVKNRPGTGKGTADSPDLQLALAKRLVEDGPDKPFLDVYVESELKAFVIGAYNLIFRTEDGGKSWQPWQAHVENPGELHLYAMRRSGQDYLLVGEQGLLLRSSDGGNTFKSLRSPYEGSFFGMIATRGGELVAFGLRGNAYWSGDRGSTWRKIEVSQPRSFSAGTELEDGTLLMTTFAGDVLTSRDRGRTFQALPNSAPSSISGVVPVPGGGILGVGMRGVNRIVDVAKLANTGKDGAGK